MSFFYHLSFFLDDLESSVEQSLKLKMKIRRLLKAKAKWSNLESIGISDAHIPHNNASCSFFILLNTKTTIAKRKLERKQDLTKTNRMSLIVKGISRLGLRIIEETFFGQQSD